MVDVDRRMNNHAHVAGLKRLSARASKGLASAVTPRKVCFSFQPFARSVIDCLKKWHVDVARGLSDEEFVKIEATFGFTFPPDLKAILQEGLPVGLGFPDWRSGSSQQLRMRLNLPIAGLSYEVSRGKFWTKQWGPKPSDMERAVHIARAALKKVPRLIPLFDHCYIPASPNLAGNPVFFVRRSDVFLCTYDLSDFFDKKGFSSFSEEHPTIPPIVGRLHDRAGSLGNGMDWCNGNGRSFRIQKQTLSSTGRRESSMDLGSTRDVGNVLDVARQEQSSERKYEETFRDPESWGRKLDSLATRSDYCLKAGGKTAGVHELDIDSQRVFRFSDVYLSSAGSSPRFLEDAMFKDNHNINEKPLRERSTSEVSLASFPLKTTPVASKVARHIEFWSDLAEKGQSSCGANGLTEPMHSLGKGIDGSKSLVKEDNSSHLLDSCVPQWLARFLEEMARILHQGGWKEEDIQQALAVTPSHCEYMDIFLDRQSMLEELVLHLNLLSDVLRRGGWSTQEVSEALDVGVSLHDESRRANKIPTHLSAQITKLAEYVAKS